MNNPVSMLIQSVIQFLKRHGVEAKAGEMFTPGAGSYLYLALLNVRMVNGEPEITPEEGEEHGQ